MLESHLRIANAAWLSGRPFGEEPLVEVAQLAQVDGRFATAHGDGDRVLLARDKLGLNKLFFALDPDRGVVAANYVGDLIDAGVPFDAVCSVPAGSMIEVDVIRWTTATHPYHQLPARAGGSTDVPRLLAGIRSRLVRHFQQIATAFPSSRVAICLSGGLDSALVAAYAREHLGDVFAYTYAFAGPAGPTGPDATSAQRLAAHLRLPHRLVAADNDKVLAALPAALRYGQDWRDFNVHCAIVNDILAEAIATDAPATQTMVLTGDLMNELLGDYAPLHYRGQLHYRLPAVAPDVLRTSLVRGIQAGDREVGVFAAHGLTVVQPYAAVFEPILRLPSSLPKHHLIRALADDSLPDWLYERPKARAQIGGPVVRDGILPLLVDSGRDARWLEDAFCSALRISDRSALGRFIRGGVYRCPTPSSRESV